MQEWHITTKDIVDFLDNHRDIEVSPAKIEYNMFARDLEEEALARARKQAVTAEDEEMAALIEAADTDEALVRLMRRGMSALNRFAFREKLLANEDMVMALIKQKTLRNRQDIFVENVLYYFLRCEENVSDWIVENYEAIKCEYMKSMLCLVLGFRGKLEMIQLLIEEAERFERLYPDESFDQGPTLAVREMVRAIMEDEWE